MTKRMFGDEKMERIKEMIETISKNDKNERIHFFKELNKTGKKNSIVFAGDSLIQRFPTTEMIQSNYNVYNRGIDGLESIELLKNIQEQIIELAPAKLFLLIGTNDVAVRRETSEIELKVKEICETVEKNVPDVKIHIISVSPLNEDIMNSRINYLNRRISNQHIIELNERYKKLAESNNYVFADIYPLLLDQRGNLKEEYTTDGLHLSGAAYRKITDFLQQFID